MTREALEHAYRLRIVSRVELVKRLRERARLERRRVLRQNPSAAKGCVQAKQVELVAIRRFIARQGVFQLRRGRTLCGVDRQARSERCAKLRIECVDRGVRRLLDGSGGFFGAVRRAQRFGDVFLQEIERLGDVREIVERGFFEVDAFFSPIFDKLGKRSDRAFVREAFALVGPGGVVSKAAVAILGDHAIRGWLVFAGEQCEHRGCERIRVAAFAQVGFAA